MSQTTVAKLHRRITAATTKLVVEYNRQNAKHALKDSDATLKAATEVAVLLEALRNAVLYEALHVAGAKRTDVALLEEYVNDVDQTLL